MQVDSEPTREPIHLVQTGEFEASDVLLIGCDKSPEELIDLHGEYTIIYCFVEVSSKARTTAALKAEFRSQFTHVRDGWYFRGDLGRMRLVFLQVVTFIEGMVNIPRVIENPAYLFPDGYPLSESHRDYLRNNVGSLFTQAVREAQPPRVQIAAKQVYAEPPIQERLSNLTSLTATAPKPLETESINGLRVTRIREHVLNRVCVSCLHLFSQEGNVLHKHAVVKARKCEKLFKLNEKTTHCPKCDNEFFRARDVHDHLVYGLCLPSNALLLAKHDFTSEDHDGSGVSGKLFHEERNDALSQMGDNELLYPGAGRTISIGELRKRFHAPTPGDLEFFAEHHLIFEEVNGNACLQITL